VTVQQKLRLRIEALAEHPSFDDKMFSYLFVDILQAIKHAGNSPKLLLQLKEVRAKRMKLYQEVLDARRS
jgi:hypothetical protein